MHTSNVTDDFTFSKEKYSFPFACFKAKTEDENLYHYCVTSWFFS